MKVLASNPFNHLFDLNPPIHHLPTAKLGSHDYCDWENLDLSGSKGLIKAEN